MFGDPLKGGPQKVYFLLVSGFSLFGLTSMLAPLRHANRTSNEMLYEWYLLSEFGGMICSSDEIEIKCNFSISEVDKCDMLIICSGTEPHTALTPGLLAFIRKQSYHGADIGCQDTGAYIAAAAGVLDGYRVTTHWENYASTVDNFPNVNFAQELLVIDRKRFSCPGALSGLDMMLHLIGEQHTNELATSVADELVYTQQRSHTDPQRRSWQIRLNSRNTNLIEAVQLMEKNIEEPLLISDLVEHIGISHRELERLFKQHLQQTPKAFYRQLRLERARRMLQQTRDSVTAISMACGFASLSHFTRSYQQLFSKKPSQER